MKTFSKVLLILMIAICMVTFLSYSVSLAGTDDSAVTADEALDKITANQSVKGTGGLTDMAGKLVSFLQVASGIAAVIMIAITGFRYVIETPEVKGELKKNMFPIIVGIILVFFAVSIAKFFLGMFNGQS